MRISQAPRVREAPAALERTKGDFIMDFNLDSRMESDSFFITDLPLCSVRLMDNKYFPWLLLIPRVNAVEWIDLSREMQHQLSDEIAIVSHILQALVTPDKLNIATLGNKIKQLHVHVIARYTSDAAWPNPVWGGAADNYAAPDANRFCYELRSALESLQL
jgi:diadenosine tetraphosphate (Ap4A) HIT family hydrolase